ncbi:MAG: hypothetical protein ACREQP_22330 [Candidatus Binatia bacterium]
MRRRVGLVVLLTTVILSYPVILPAQYTLVLKNGRRITVQAYREEGQTIKIYGIGGEIGIPRAEVQSILRAGEEGRGLDLRGTEGMEGEVSRPEGQEPRPEGPGAATTPAEATPDQRAKEEEDYRKRIEEVTAQLNSVKDRYLAETRASSSRDPMLLETDEAIRARNEDLSSRLKDLQHNPEPPSDAGPVKLSVPSAFTGQPPGKAEIRPGEGLNTAGIPIYTPPVASPAVRPPPPAYTEREKELSDLRSRLNQLVKERERLIEEMKQKNFDTGLPSAE